MRRIGEIIRDELALLERLFAEHHGVESDKAQQARLREIEERREQRQQRRRSA